MFGSDNEKGQRLVGAKEKREKAAQFRPHAFELKSKREGQEGSKIVPLAVIYMIAIIFAWILTDGPIKSGLGIHTGNPSFDRLFFGPGDPTLFSSQEVNLGAIVFIRGTFLFLLGGLLPGLTYVFQGLTDGARRNIYLSFWGVTLTTGLAYYLIRDYAGPALKQVIDIFF
jgi:hypothetical protein